jgi:hypothetical protein
VVNVRGIKQFRPTGRKTELSLARSSRSASAPPATGPSTGTVELTRPVYPYPEQVKYSGTGNPDLAASYEPVAPSVSHQDDYKWAGYPYRSGYEEWCQLSGDAKALVCKREGEQGPA